MAPSPCNGQHPGREARVGPWTEDQCRLCWKALNPELAKRPPGLVRRAGNFIRSATQHVAHGGPTLSREDTSARLAICQGCDEFNRETSQCRVCGCNMEIKASWADMECPIGKWPKGPPVSHETVSALAGPPPEGGWPAGWETWQATAEAHRPIIEKAAQEAIAATPLPAGGTALGGTALGGGRGITTCAGGARYFACAYILLHVLRRVHRCEMPIEVWFLGPEEMSPGMARLLVDFGGVRLVDAQAVARSLPDPPRHLGGWEAKIFAIRHSAFEEVLFLDADQIPLTDPACVFEWEEYQRTGAVLWPDLPNDLGLDVEAQAFQACGLPVPGRSKRPQHLHPHRPLDYRPVESGQVLVDRRRRGAELRLASALADRADYFYRRAKANTGVNLIYGDKSLFFLSWWKIHQIASGEGEVNYLGRPANFAMPPDTTWVGNTTAGAFLQKDFHGHPIFAHRCQPVHKWRLHGANAGAGIVPLHAECVAALDELRGRWAGHPYDWGEHTPEDRRIAESLPGRWVLYDGTNGQPITLSPAGGRVEGSPTVPLWSVFHQGIEARLALTNRERAVKILGLDANGFWQNGTVALIPAPPEGWSYPPDRAGPVVWEEVYRRNEYRLPERFPPRSCVLDIGAHVGTFVRACLDRGAHRVTCVEPDPENLRYLLANVGHELRVRIVPGAAWPSPGELLLSRPTGAEHSGGGSVLPGTGVPVRAIPFGDLLWEAGGRVDLLKLDCEGAEWELLRTADLSPVERVVGEYHLGGAPEWASVEWLRDKLEHWYDDVEVVPSRAEGLGHFFGSCRREGSG